MIYGVGTDICSLKRITLLLEKAGRERLSSKVLSEGERVYLKEKNKNLINFLSGRWVAKEALSKALGTGFCRFCRLKDISILNDRLGKPIVKFKGETLKYWRSLGSLKAFISISHSKSDALAFVVIEKGLI